jgi:hypothetical protein
MKIRHIIQIVGAVLGAMYNVVSFVADSQQWLPTIKWQYHAIAGFALFVGFMVWMVIDRQHEINILRGDVRIIPVPKNISHFHDDQTNKDGVKFDIDFELWTNIDIHTNSVVLNITGIRHSVFTTSLKNIWRIWEWIPDYPFGKKLVGLRPSQGEYRKAFKKDSKQLFKETITFRMSSRVLKKSLQGS